MLSQFPASIDLSSLNGTNGFVLNGEAANDYSGWSVSAAGDVNGDGIQDIIIGACLRTSIGLTQSGRSYVVFGSRTIGNGVVNLGSLNGVNGFVLNGEATGDYSGYSVSAAGDVNGDGVGDVIVGAPDHASLGLTNSGRSYVVFGSRAIGNGIVNLGSLNGANGFVLNGEITGDYNGVSVSAAGDVNGDGVGDVIVGAPDHASLGLTNSGRSYVVFGSRTIGNGIVNLGSLDGTNGFILNGEAAGDASGESVSAAGDVNGDGVGDVIVGAPDHASLGLTNSGRSYVVFGSRTIGNGIVNLASLDGTNGFVLNGEAENDYSGWSVSGAGDVNSDGFADVIVGAYGHASLGLTNSGRSYVIFGTRNTSYSVLNLNSLNGANGFVLNGEATGDWSGYSVSSAGDVDGDGVGDLIVGARYHTSLGLTWGGRSYVIFGTRNTSYSVLNLNSLNGANGFVLNGEEAYDDSGYSVSAVGDVNGDGLDDVIVGAKNHASLGLSYSGRSYVVFGVPPITSSPTVSPTNELTQLPSRAPTKEPSRIPTYRPSEQPSLAPSTAPSKSPTFLPTGDPTLAPTQIPSIVKSNVPSLHPTLFLSTSPSQLPSRFPTYQPSSSPTQLFPNLPTNASSVLSGIDPMPSDNTVRNAMIGGGVVAGTIGLTCLGLKLCFTYKAKQAFEQFIAAESEAGGALQEHVIRPVAKEVFNHISITGCLGYISDDSMEQYITAVTLLVSALDRYHVPMATLGTMAPVQKRCLLDEIVKQIKACCLSAGCCSTVGRLFRPSMTSAMLSNKVDDIASAVREHLQSRAMGVTVSREKHQYHYKNKKNTSRSEIEFSERPVFLPGISKHAKKSYVWNPSNDLKAKNLGISAFGSRVAVNQVVATEKDDFFPVPWHIDPAIKPAAGTVQGYALLSASQADMIKVVDSYQRSSVPGYNIKSVKVVYSPGLTRAFDLELELLNARHGKPAFEAKWKKEAGESGQWRQATHAILETMAAPYKDSSYPHVTLLPMWHATKQDVLPSLFSAGFANLAEIDSGFFGKGIYSAGEAKYSWTVYGKMHQHPALLMNWVAAYSAYPVIEGDMQQLMAGANVGNCDAHFIPVRPKTPNNPHETTFLPCASGQPYTYTELVVFNPRQCLARYLVELQSDLLPSLVADTAEAQAAIEQANASDLAAIAQFGVMAHKAAAPQTEVGDTIFSPNPLQSYIHSLPSP